MKVISTVSFNPQKVEEALQSYSKPWEVKSTLSYCLVIWRFKISFKSQLSDLNVFQNIERIHPLYLKRKVECFLLIVMLSIRDDLKLSVYCFKLIVWNSFMLLQFPGKFLAQGYVWGMEDLYDSLLIYPPRKDLADCRGQVVIVSEIV